MSLHDLFKIHKETVLFNKESGFNVECILKPKLEYEGISISGFCSFTGCTFSKDGEAFFGDVFELTINLDELKKYTDSIPLQGWFVSVFFPQINNKKIDFTIENAPVDRTLGTCLLRCSALTDKGKGKRVDRAEGGI